MADDAVEPGHLEVEHDEVRLVLGGELDRGAPVAGLGDDLEVGLELEQRRERLAHEVLVVGQQEPDHAVRARRGDGVAGGGAGGSCGRPMRRAADELEAARRRAASPRPARRRPRSARAGPRRRCRPRPGTTTRATPSSIMRTTTSSPSRSTAISQRAARVWRSRFVAPSRTSEPNSGCSATGTDSGVPSTSASTPAAWRIPTALASSVASPTRR